MTSMKAIVYEGPNQVACREIPVPVEKEGWVTIQVSHAGICGSDQTIYRGKHPRAKAPLVLGHEFSGYITRDMGDFRKGDLVTVFPYLPCHNCERCKNGQFHVCQNLKLIGIDLDGGMAEYVSVPEWTVCKVPESCTPAQAAFIEPVGISVHAARKGGYRPGDSVVIFGAGGIGMATAITLRQFGANPIIAEPNPLRLALAKEMGFDVLDPKQDTIQQIYARTGGIGADFVYDCAGAQPVIDLLPDAVRINGTIVIVAGYKDPPAMNFQKGMFREFTIQFVRNCTREDFEIATRLMGQGLGYDRLLNYIVDIEKGAEGFAPPPSAYKVIFEVNHESI